MMATPQIYRKRLINAINHPGHHIVYIYGPSGFGKSTLARDWKNSQELPTVWVEGFSTSKAEDLFLNFVTEICRVMPNLSDKLSSLTKNREVTKEVLVKFAQILESDKTPFNIVIENAEEIRRSHNELSMTIVKLMPKHIKLILVTSTSPSSSFVSEAGIKRFAVISPEDLRFNLEEIKQLLHDVTPDLTETEAHFIEQLTEGWPASTEVAVSILRSNPELRGELSVISLKGKSLFANETNKVLGALEVSQRELLKALSPLQDITTDVAFEITGNLDVVRQLTLLTQDSIIVSQISQNPPKFRIHPIFRKVLIDEFRKEDGFGKAFEVLIEKLLRRGEIRQATRILIELGETPRLSQLLRDPKMISTIEISIQDAIYRSELNELRDWVLVSEHLPVVGSLGKSILNFYICFLKADYSAAESHIRILESDLQQLDSEFAAGWQSDVLVLKSLLSFALGKLEDNWNFAVSAFETRKSDKTLSTRHQLNYLQVALWGAFLSDDYEKVQKVTDMLDDLVNLKQSAFHNAVVSGMRCLIAAHEGRLIESQNNLITPATSKTQLSTSGYFGAYGVRFAQSIISGELGNLEESVRTLNLIAEDAIASHNLPIAIAALGRQGYHLSLLRRYEEGLRCVSRAREILNANQISGEIQPFVDMWEVRIRHFMLDNVRVHELLKRCKPSYFVRSFQAALAISVEDFETTKSLISEFDLEIPRQAVTHHLFKAYLLKDSPGSQLRAIASAVELGSKHGYFHHFITQRSDILQQYISLAAENPTAFNERLAQAAGVELNKMMTAQSATGEKLTRREADILRHLATGLPLKEISHNLSISKNTMKTHLRNLYRKLGATDREDAVNKGKKLLKV